jgi:hypothetical protein
MKGEEKILYENSQSPYTKNKKQKNKKKEIEQQSASETRCQ